MSNATVFDEFHIGDHVVVNSGQYEGLCGELEAFDLTVPVIAVKLHAYPAILVLNPDQIDHAPDGEDEDEGQDEAADGPLEKLESDGPWLFKVKVVNGALAGSEGELLGPNRILSEKLGETMINVQLDDGSLKAVAERNVEFVLFEED